MSITQQTFKYILVKVRQNILCLLNKIFSKFSKNKDNNMRSLANTIAHELRTPLTTIQQSALGVKDILPILINAYHTAKTANLPVQEIHPKTLDLINSSLENLIKQTHASFLFINMILTHFRKESFIQITQSKCSASHIIQSAFEQYPLYEQQKALFHIDIKNDFQLRGQQELLEHVFFNLIKNALYYVAAANKGEIFIWSVLGKKYNEIHFKDTGTGISAEKIPRIFDRFFSDRYHGTGVGLSYCKSVMEGLGGKITVHSVLNEHTEFVLFFPR